MVVYWFIPPPDVLPSKFSRGFSLPQQVEEAPSEVPKKMTLKDRMKFFEDEMKKDKETAPKGRQLIIRFVDHWYGRQELGKKKQRKDR